METHVPDSTLVIHPNAGHGGGFRYADDFAAAVLGYLGGDSSTS
ncbi:hypothetical protein [Corynebacterium nuruki]